MRLYWNEVVVDRHASKEPLETAIARFRVEPYGGLRGCVRRQACSHGR